MSQKLRFLCPKCGEKLIHSYAWDGLSTNIEIVGLCSVCKLIVNVQYEINDKTIIVIQELKGYTKPIAIRCPNCGTIVSNSKYSTYRNVTIDRVCNNCGEAMQTQMEVNYESVILLHKITGDKNNGTIVFDPNSSPQWSAVPKASTLKDLQALQYRLHQLKPAFEDCKDSMRLVREGVFNKFNCGPIITNPHSFIKLKTDV